MSDSNPVGYFKYILAIDCETTGLCFNSNPVTNGTEHHQAVSWGLIVADADTLKPVEDLYIEIKWNSSSAIQRNKDDTFGRQAEEIHGLTYQYLEENGIDEQQAVVAIGNLILKYWGPNGNIRTLGHNVHMFDLPFLKDLFNRHEIPLKFGNRHYDTNSVGFATVGSYNSDDLFKTILEEDRGQHNALDDAEFQAQVVIDGMNGMGNKKESEEEKMIKKYKKMMADLFGGNK